MSDDNDQTVTVKLGDVELTMEQFRILSHALKLQGRRPVAEELRTEMLGCLERGIAQLKSSMGGAKTGHLRGEA